MEDWLRAGRRIKADWVAMLEGIASRSREPVKIPFVPLRVSGRALRAVLEDVLPVILGENPSLLTVIVCDGGPGGGKVIKAYAEDASQGVYEKLVKLPVEEGALSRGETGEKMAELARAAGVEPGVVKEAQTGFFEAFTEEPEDLLDALALLAAEGAEALRRGLLRFDPPLPAAELAKLVRLPAGTLKRIASRLLPEGRYGLGLSCTGGSGGLVLDVGPDGWSVREFEANASTVSDLAGELVDQQRCGIGVSLRVPSVCQLAGGERTLPEFLRGRGEDWDIQTRSGLEGLLAAVPRLAPYLGVEGDLEECNITFESILDLALDYLHSAVEYARGEGFAVKLIGIAQAGARPIDGDPSAGHAGESVTVAFDAEGVKEAPGPSAAVEPGAGEALGFDLSLLRRAVSFLASDPLAGVRELVPLEVTGRVSYATAMALVGCRRGGKLLLFGGPHRFLAPAWEGDACAVFVEADGRLHVAELPSTPLVVMHDIAHDGGIRVELEADDVRLRLHFERVRSRSDLHGAGRLVGRTKLADWLPGLEVVRGLFRLSTSSDASRADFRGRELELDRGWMYLEEGGGRLLRWPFGSTWHYASWLFPRFSSETAECGSGVHAAPMLGRSTPNWWRKALRAAVDGAAFVTPDADGCSDFETALEPGPPVRLVRDAARAGTAELRYQVLSAALVPFDEDGQMIFRLRCLVSDRDSVGAGLVEIPAGLPGTPPVACRCELAFTEGGISCLADGRELLLVETPEEPTETGEPGFLSPYRPPGPGFLRRLARRLGAR